MINNIALSVIAGICGYFIPEIAARMTRAADWSEMKKPAKTAPGGRAKIISAVIAAAATFAIAPAAPANGIVIAFGILCAITMSVADLRARIIPDLALFPFMLSGLSVADALPWIAGGINEAVLAAIAGYAIGVAIEIMFAKRAKGNVALGAGDIKLLAAIGIWTGGLIAWAIAVGCAGAYIWGKITKNKFAPLAPFLLAGAFVAIVVGMIFS